MKQNRTPSRLAIVGGGAAGFFAAANLAELCPELKVSIYEGSKRVLTKVEVSGGGRCNVTHDCADIIKLSESYPRGKYELRGPFSRFAPSDTAQWFSARGVELKTEEDGRMFPVTDSSQTIIDCLIAQTKKGNFELRTQAAIQAISRNQSGFTLALPGGKSEQAEFVLLATGSSKSGYKMAASLGHSITECAPSLFTFKSKDLRLKDLAGISFPEVHLTLRCGTDSSFSQEGPLLITHWGLSGPAVLKLSAFTARELARSKYKGSLTVNWIAGTSEQEAQEKLSSLRRSSAKKELGANPQFSLTRRFWESILGFCDIPLNLHFSELSNLQIKELSEVLTRSKFAVEGRGEFKEEFVTCGGVKLSEIDFRTFESKLVPGLFFAGEILDIDGITGGYNFQAAWTAAWLVAQAIKATLESTLIQSQE